MSDSDAERGPGDVAANTVEPAASPEALRAENARLRAEVARLRATVPDVARDDPQAHVPGPSYADLVARLAHFEQQQQAALVERLQAEQAAFRESEETTEDAVRRLQFALRSAHLGLWDWNIQANTMEWDDEMLGMYGLTRETFPGGIEAWQHGLHPEDRERAIAECKAALDGNREFNTEFRVLHPDGSVRHLKADGLVLRDEGGAPLRMLGLNGDITGRKRAEEALREAHLRTTTVLEAIADAFYSLDEEWRFVVVNPAAERAPFGRPASELLGKVIWDEFPAIVGTRIHQYYLDAVNKRRMEHYEAPSPLNGRWYEVFMYPRKEGLDVYLRDINERRRAEEALREADRQKNQFLAVLSHELRNPLTPIKNSIYILDRAAPGGEQANRAKAVIDRQTTHLARLVDDLLDVSRIISGKLRLQRARFDLSQVLRRTAEDHHAVLADGGITLDVRVSREPCWMDGDETRMAQAVGNLLGNSAKFTQQGGVVVLELEAAAATGTAVIRVRDTGVGVHADLLHRLFEPFVQADNTLDRSKGGLGLGLALVKSVIELHGGSVEAHSDGPGKGTEFVLRVPIDAQAVLSLDADGHPSDRPPPRRVLVIEDNIDAADSLKEAVELGAHQVEVAYDGPTGIEKAREFKPDVVLCDIGLPGMSGYDVAKAFRADEKLRSTHLVALTGYAQPEDLQRATESGFDGHVAKPPSLEKIEAVLRALPAMK